LYSESLTAVLLLLVLLAHIITVDVMKRKAVVLIRSAAPLLTTVRYVVTLVLLICVIAEMFLDDYVRFDKKNSAIFVEVNTYNAVHDLSLFLVSISCS
jgi:hypothetical protein